MYEVHIKIELLLPGLAVQRRHVHKERMPRRNFPAVDQGGIIYIVAHKAASVVRQSHIMPTFELLCSSTSAVSAQIASVTLKGAQMSQITLFVGSNANYYIVLCTFWLYIQNLSCLPSAREGFNAKLKDTYVLNL